MITNDKPKAGGKGEVSDGAASSGAASLMKKGQAAMQSGQEAVQQGWQKLFGGKKGDADSLELEDDDGASMAGVDDGASTIGDVDVADDEHLLYWEVRWNPYTLKSTLKTPANLFVSLAAVPFPQCA